MALDDIEHVQVYAILRRLLSHPFDTTAVLAACRFVDEHEPSDDAMIAALGWVLSETDQKENHAAGTTEI